MKIIGTFIAVTLLAIVSLAVGYRVLFTNTDWLKFNKTDSYKTEWAKVDSLEKRGLPKSAIEIVNRIYDKAKKSNNSPQLIKSIIFKMKFADYVQEDTFETMIYDLEKETKLAVYPTKPILTSLLAEVYWMYYQTNRWKFYNRTTTVNFDQADVKTWDLNHLVDKVIKNYMLSLENKDSLQRTPIEAFDDIIEKGNVAKNLRPSLYDFLANRAIDFFSSSELTLNKPADEFNLKEDFYFAEASDFVKNNIKTSDSLSPHFYAVKLLQELLRFRLADNNSDALIDVDLKRLNLAYNYSVNLQKDTLYITTLTKLEQKYADNPHSSEVSYSIADYYNDKSAKFNYLDESTIAYKWNKQRAHDICEKVISKYPKSTGAEKCKFLKHQLEKIALNFEYDEVNVSAKNLLTKINYANLSKVYLRIGSIDREKLETLKAKYYGTELFEKLKKEMVIVQQKAIDLPDDKSFNPHGVELIIDPLALGTYIMLVSDNEGFQYENKHTAYTIATVSDLAYTYRQNDEDGSYDFFVVNRTSGLPLADVQADVWYSKYEYVTRSYKKIKLGNYLTNAEGYFKIPYIGKDEARSFYVEFKKGKDYLNSNSSFYSSFYGNQKTVITQTFFFTDRAIYRPGQTVYFKGIVIENNGESKKIKPNYSGNVVFRDANYQDVSELKLTTNEFGTISGSFQIPTGLMNGQFSISGFNGNIYISIEEYKRPKFEAEILPFNDNYQLNDSVEVKGQAKAYAGPSISDAMVAYRVVRKPVWRGWWYCPYNLAEVEIANGKTITDEKGEFKVKFIALPDLSIPKNDNVVFNYEISADVTDINGETMSSKKNLTVGYKSLEVFVNIPELLNKEAEDKFEISTQNLNGEFVTAAGSYKILLLDEPAKAKLDRKWAKPDGFIYTEKEWTNLLPDNVYKDADDIRKLAKKEQVSSGSFDTQKDKKFKLSAANWKEGRYLLEINSTDVFGKPVKQEQFFTLYSAKAKQQAYPSQFQVVPIKENGEPGDFAKYLISSDRNISVLYEIEHKNKIISKKWIQLNNEQQLIEIPIIEAYRGNFAVHFTAIKDNRAYVKNSTITIPYTNKELDITFETFRDKLYPGQKEEWRVKIKGKNGDKVAAEMMATLYDASLDNFRANYWNMYIYNSYYATLNLTAACFNTSSSLLLNKNNEYISFPSYDYDKLNWFGFNSYYRGGGYIRGSRIKNNMMSMSAPAMEGETTVAEKKDQASADVIEYSKPLISKDETVSGVKKAKAEGQTALSDGDARQEQAAVAKPQIRTNFNETAFFYPSLMTNENGEVIIKFTIPESLTKWKMMGLAHTQDLKYGFIQNELITQKDLMVMPNAPRFFREGDNIEFPVKVSNVSDKDLTVDVKFEFFDALTMLPLNLVVTKDLLKPILIKSKENGLFTRVLQIPEGVQAITYRVTATAGNFSDGEENVIPVLTNRMLVTESLPLPIRGKQTKNFEFTKLINSGSSSTLKHQQLTLEFTSNPAWYAVQALPYLMEYPYECAEQVFSRYYANSLASHVANSSPNIKRVFDSWKNMPDSKALLSNLEKNQELKSLMLQETPWVLNSQDETERKRRVGLLFDLNKMGNELNSAITKLEKMQTSNGGWPWFTGMPESRYITQHVVTGLGKLDHLGVKNVREDSRVWKMTTEAIDYLDIRMYEDYEWLKSHYNATELAKNHLSYDQIHYLYSRSFFLDIKIPRKTQAAFDYYKQQAEKYWLDNNKYMQGMIALALNRYGNKKVPADIVKSLKEFSLTNEEMGMYWKENNGGYYWYQSPIETQAMMIEVFDEVAADQKAVDDLKVWLLKQKQTQDWKTTKATVEAVYALLLRGTQWLETNDLVEIKLGGQLIDPKKMDDVKVEAGTGYFKAAWKAGDIKPEMGKVTVTKNSEGVAWGALYWQYFENLDKITPHETPLSLKKKLFIERNSDRGKIIEPLEEKTKLKIGDKLIVRIELRVDRTMEYIHMKDMRASGFEPINVISRYKYQDGLGYYESTKDAATNFFISYLPKGTYVFEYPLRVTHNGNFSNGVTTIQCMYAPEFTSHSEGIRVEVEK